MNIQITDLMDLYLDQKPPFEAEAAASEAPGDPKVSETVGLEQRRRRFGWREALSLAAVLAFVVLGGLGLRRWMLRRGGLPSGESLESSDLAGSTASPQGTDSVHYPGVELLSGPEQEELSRLLTPWALGSVGEGGQWQALGASPCFALAECVMREEDFVSFSVYAAPAWLWPEAVQEELPALSSQEVETLLQERKLIKLQDGTASLEYQEGQPRVTECKLTPVSLDPVRLREANLLLTAFALQNIRDSALDLTEEGEMAAFVHSWARQTDSGLVAEEGYETMTLERLNRELERLLNRRLSPLEGTVYPAPEPGDGSASFRFQDGRFWFPAGEQTTPRFAAVSFVASQGGGVRCVGFQVYETGPEAGPLDWSAHAGMSWEQAEALADQGILLRQEQGCAWLRDDGIVRLIRYALIPEDGPLELDNAPLSGTAWNAGAYGTGGEELYLRSDGTLFYRARDGADIVIAQDGHWELEEDGTLLMQLWPSAEADPENPRPLGSKPGQPSASPLIARYQCRRLDGSLILTQTGLWGLGDHAQGDRISFRLMNWELYRQPEPIPADPDSDEDLKP